MHRLKALCSTDKPRAMDSLRNLIFHKQSSLSFTLVWKQLVVVPGDPDNTMLVSRTWCHQAQAEPGGPQAHEEINAPASCSTAVGRQTPRGRIVQFGRLCILTRIIKAPSKRSMSALSAPEGVQEPVEPGGRVGAPATPLALGLLPFAVSSYLRFFSSYFCLFHPPTCSMVGSLGGTYAMEGLQISPASDPVKSGAFPAVLSKMLSCPPWPCCGQCKC